MHAADRLRGFRRCVRTCSFFRRRLLLCWFANRHLQHLLDKRVGNFDLRVGCSWRCLHWCDTLRVSWHNQGGILDSSYVLAFLLVQHGVLDHHFVREALSDAKLAALFLAESAQHKGKELEFGVDFADDLPRCLHLELVLHVDTTFVNCRTRIFFLGLTVSRAQRDIYRVNLVGSKLDRFYALFDGRPRKDRLVAIDHKLLHLMAQDAFQHGYAVLARNPLDQA
mmetsp:Transcript_15666/g.42228  ORF Transcript_15666/g.42228 Transcript_15666/m.42228 type:complete len:224 (-) Transcript_15666:548-1219(-)